MGIGKTSKWLRNLLTGKKSREKYASNDQKNHHPNSNSNENPVSSTSTTPKEKRRWSFRRPSASAPPPSISKQFNNSAQPNVTNTDNVHQNKHFTIISTEEEVAAIKIQSVFRSYLARQALCALRGIVKLQALVRGHLVRKQAMEALLTAQGRACAHRIPVASQPHLTHTNTSKDNLWRHIYHTEMDRGLDIEDIKIVEMNNVCDSKFDSRSRNRNINYIQQQNGYEYYEHRFSTYYPSQSQSSFSISKQENHKVSPSPSAQSSPASKADDHAKLGHYSLVPNYMANTESSRAKFRSHSAPKQRPESFERQPSRQRASKRTMKMQRSSSHVGTTAQNYHYPWSIKLDRSTVSLIESECGSTSTVLTNANYCRSLAAYDPHHEDSY